MMIKLSEDHYVSATHIAEVRSIDGRVFVKTHDGSTHSVGNEYGNASYQTIDRLISEINAARKGEQ